MSVSNKIKKFWNWILRRPEIKYGDLIYFDKKGRPRPIKHSRQGPPVGIVLGDTVKNGGIEIKIN